jgi:lysophospholipase L1-like esterase
MDYTKKPGHKQVFCRRIIVVILIFILASFSDKKKIRWVAIGDSITYLNEHANETGNRVKQGYLTRVAAMAPEISYINKGYNGWTAKGIADNIDSLGLQQADVYTVFLGTNDWWSGRPVGTLQHYTSASGSETLYGSFRIIIDKLRNLNKSARIVLITPLKRTDFVYLEDFHNNAYGSYKPRNGQWLHEVAAAIKTIGEYEKLPVIDLYNDAEFPIDRLVKFKRLRDSATNEYKNYPYPEYINKPFDPSHDQYPYPEDAIDLTYDGLHPSDAGNELIAGRIIECFKKMRLIEKLKVKS